MKAVLGLVTAVGLLGCGDKKLPSLIAERQAAFATVDNLIQRANQEVAKVPEGGTEALPACQPSASYLFHPMGDKHNTDVVGRSWLAERLATPLERALQLREIHGKKSALFGDKATFQEESALKQLDGIKHLIVVREHKGSSEDHVGADVFLVSGEPPRIVCAFPLEGGVGVRGSSGTVIGTEIRKDRATGRTVSERVVRTGGTEGTTPREAAVERFHHEVADKLGIALGYAREVQQLADSARRRAGLTDGTPERAVAKAPAVDAGAARASGGGSATSLADMKEIHGITSKLGCKVRPAKPSVSDDVTSMRFINPGECEVILYDFSKHPVYDIGERRVLFVNAYLQRPLAEATLKILKDKKVSTLKEAEAALRAADYQFVLAPPAAIKHFLGPQSLLVKKGGEQLSVSVLDLGFIVDKEAPEQYRQPAAMARDGDRLLLVEIKDPVAAIAAFRKK